MRGLIVLITVVVAGCTPSGELSAPGGVGFSDSCDAQAQRRLVGRELTDKDEAATAAGALLAVVLQ